MQLREPHTELVTLGMSGQPGWEGCLQAKGCFSPLKCLPHGCLLKAKQTNALKSVINQKPQRQQQAGLPTPRRCWPGLKELIPGEGWWAYVGLHIESPWQSPCRWQQPVKRKSGRTCNLQTFLERAGRCHPLMPCWAPGTDQTFGLPSASSLVPFAPLRTLLCQLSSQSFLTSQPRALNGRVRLYLLGVYVKETNRIYLFTPDRTPADKRNNYTQTNFVS